MKTIIDGKKIYVQIPYDLKDAFKQTFRTTEWSSGSKMWIIANTPKNTEKLTQFEAMVSETEAQIKASEDADLTTAQLDTISKEINKVSDSFISTQESIKRHQDLKLRLDGKKAILKAKVEELAIVKKEEEALVAGNEAQIKEILSQFAWHGMSIEEAIDKASRDYSTYSRTHRNSMDDFNSIQSFLSTTYETIKKEFKLDFFVLYQCSNANKNRHDRDSIWFERSVFDERYIKDAEEE